MIVFPVQLDDSLTNIQWLGKMTGETVVNHRDTRVVASEKQLEQVNLCPVAIKNVRPLQMI